MIIEQYAYHARIKDIDPTLKLFVSVMFLLLTLMMYKMVTILFIFLIAFLSISYFGRISPIRIIKLLLIPMVFLLTSVIAILISFSEQKEELIFAIPFIHGYLGATWPGIWQGIFLFIKALTATCCLYFLILTTPMVAILSSLRRLRVPNSLITIMELIYRFIFIMTDTAGSIYLAQSSRLGYRSYRRSISSLGQLASMVFIRAFLRVDDLFKAMESRGYNGTICVYEEDYERYSRGYVYCTTLVLSIILIEIVCRRYG